MKHSFAFRALGALALVMVVGGLLAAGCESDAPPAPLSFEGSDPLFTGFSFDTGLVPDGAPVAASFSLHADGAANVHADAMASGSADDPALTGTPATGGLAVSGGFGLEGRLVVDVTGLPSYDGPIPGIENVLIGFASEIAFDPFSIDRAVETRADIPASRLPAIPLPGGLPGSLVLEVVEGSFVTVTLTGVSACVEGSEARYAVNLDRAGRLVIRPTIEIEVPIVGTKSFEIPEFTVPLTLASTVLTMTHDDVAFGAAPDVGDRVSQRCTGAHAGGANPGGANAGGANAGGANAGGSNVGGTSAGGAGGGVPCSSAGDCDGVPCVEGTCGNGEGICLSGASFGDDTLDACVTATCCDEVETCTFDYSDIDGCNACIANDGGARCDGLLACIAGC